MTVDLHSVVVTTGGRTLVDVTDVRLERGRAVTIVGESGSGKSLLAHALMGTLPPELDVRGRATLDGNAHDLADRRARRSLWGRTLALLPQEPVLALDPTMRVRSQVAEGAESWRSDRPAAHRRAQALLTSVGLGGEQRSYPHTLSGGMAQRVAFAAATIGGAGVLLADEPSKGLDDRARGDLAALLRRHLADGGALLTITHDLELARALGGEVLVMKEAEVLERGPAEQVLHRPQHDYTRRLLAAEPDRWHHEWMRAAAPDDDRPELVRGMGLSKAFGDKALFDGLDVTVQAGERVALTGPSGAGKTTLGNVLLGLAAPDAGSVKRSSAVADGRLQKLYQDPAQAFPARVPLDRSLGDVVRRHRRDPAQLPSLLHALGLDAALLARRPGQVSGGELQRIAIARAVLLRPALLFADEPTSRLDLVTQEETVRCLMEQLAPHDCALVLVTHDETLARAVCDRRVTVGEPALVDAPR